MKSKFLVLAVICGAGAVQAQTYVDYARVVSSRPIYESVPEEVCRDVRYDRQPTRSSGREGSGVGTVIGGVAGGILGRQVGEGSGKDVATVIGAVTGAVVGNRIGGRGGYDERDYGPSVRRECTREYREVLAGYDVVYEYQGQRGQTRMSRDPGRRLKMRVTVEPVERD